MTAREGERDQTTISRFRELLEQLRDRSRIQDHDGEMAVQLAIQRHVLNTFGKGSPEHDLVRQWKVGEAVLDEMITTLEGRRGEDATTRVGSQKVVRTPRQWGKKVFVVHGWNQGLLSEVEGLLRGIEVEPIVLRQEANIGRTLIEKFEDHASECGFAIVLLTGDDEGGPKRKGVGRKPPLKWKPRIVRRRARQNVILELGFFLGRLGRERVCALYEEGVEVPSDYSGVAFVPLKGAWKAELVRELVACGLPINQESALRLTQRAP